MSETDLGEVKILAKRKAPVYAFFEAEPAIQWAKDGKTAQYLEYSCTQCGMKIKQGLLTADRSSTSECLPCEEKKETHERIGNLNNHARRCWGDEAVDAVKESTLGKAREALRTLGKKTQKKLTLMLKEAKNWAMSFSTLPPSNEAIR